MRISSFAYACAFCTSFERRVSQDEELNGEQGQRHFQIDQKGRRQTANGPQAKTCGPSGGLFGIDQEVVTLRGLSRQLPGQGPKRKAEVPRMKALARPTPCLHPHSPASVRAVAHRRYAPGAPLRATSPKSQPPHLVLDSHNYYHIQNLSFDHLLSGVSPH